MPIALIQKVVAVDREREDVARFHTTSVTNKMFSVLLSKHFRCPRNHQPQDLTTSVGLTLDGPKKPKQSLKALVAAYFQTKISPTQCRKCRHVSKDNGTEQLRILDFPKYLIIFLNPFDEKGGLNIPLKHFDSKLDLTGYK